LLTCGENISYKDYPCIKTQTEFIVANIQDFIVLKFHITQKKNIPNTQTVNSY
jgi:hypothetical protein